MGDFGSGGVLGVLGGMGPLASAEFVRTVYECSGRACAREQEAPAVVLYSDPAMPDRTAALLAGGDDVLLERLTEALRLLSRLGAERVVICCMTIHYLLPRLPAELRRRVIPLTDVIFERLARDGGRHLLVCSNGTREMRIFERHDQWARRAANFVLPAEADQRRIHELIYEVKRNRGVNRTASFLKTLLARYGVESFIAGCSEIHLVAKRFAGRGVAGGGYGCVDPFRILAEEAARPRPAAPPLPPRGRVSAEGAPSARPVKQRQRLAGGGIRPARSR